MRILATLAIPLLTLQACGGGSNEPTACAAVVIFHEPIVLVDAVAVEGETGTLSRVMITDLQRDGVPVGLPLLEQSTAIVQTADGLECSVPCALGTTEGTYTFQLNAPGFAARAVSVEARYAVFKTGCPTSYSGGTHISASMRRL